MEKGLDYLINLIEESLSLEDPEKIKEIEEEIQITFQNIQPELDDSVELQSINKEKIDKLALVMEKLNSKYNSQKKFLDDFSNFLKNRKIN